MSATIGAALRAERERRQLALAQVSETTRIRQHYLQALENDDVSAIPSAAQARGFLKIYAGFLGLNLDVLLQPPATPTAAGAPAEPTPPESAVPSNPKAARPGLLRQLRDRIATRGAGNADAGSNPPGNAPPKPPEAQPTRSLPEAQPRDSAESKKKVSG